MNKNNRGQGRGKPKEAPIPAPVKPGEYGVIARRRHWDGVKLREDPPKAEKKPSIGGAELA